MYFSKKEKKDERSRAYASTVCWEYSFSEDSQIIQFLMTDWVSGDALYFISCFIIITNIRKSLIFSWGNNRKCFKNNVVYYGIKLRNIVDKICLKVYVLCIRDIMNIYEHLLKFAYEKSIDFFCCCNNCGRIIFRVALSKLLGHGYNLFVNGFVCTYTGYLYW